MSITEVNRLRDLGIEVDEIIDLLSEMRETLTKPEDFEDYSHRLEWFDTSRDMLLEALRIK